MEQRNSAAANTRLRHTDWHALWSSSYACAWCTPFSKGTFPLVNPLRGNIPLAGAHFRALLAPVTVLLYGAKTWQLLDFELDVAPFEEAVRAFRLQCDQAVAKDAAVQAYVRQLEQDYDAPSDEAPCSRREENFSPEQLMHELEDFLRQEREGRGD